jgi:nitronate monooxygenase
MDGEAQMGTQLRSLLGVEHGIIQAPMAGATTPELVAAVSNAGGLGMLPGAYQTPEQIADSIAATRRLTSRPFGVNLFAGGDEPDEGVDAGPMLAMLAEIHTELGIPAPSMPEGHAIPFDAQLEAVLEAEVAIFSFTMGIPSADQMAAMRARGMTTIGTATTVTEARQLAAAGVDAVVAQGSEAGAHRGTFAGPIEAALIGTLALVPQIVDAVSLPVIASGGIMDGRGIVAVEALGAAGVQMGTAFLTCQEAGIAAAWREAIFNARESDTTLTRAFSGRVARGIANAFIERVEQQPEAILPFPMQNGLTRPLRNAAAARGDARYLSLWVGQGAPLARDTSASELVARLVREAAEVRQRVATGID